MSACSSVKLANWYASYFHNQRVGLIEWFYYYPLTQLDDNTFAFPDYGLYHGEKLSFARNAEGVAAQVVTAEVKFVRHEVGTKDGETLRTQK